MKFTDDQEIRESVVWLDGEKIAWRSKVDDWSVALDLDEGSHRMLLEVIDTQGLKTSRQFHLYAHGKDAKASPLSE